jgi:ankyrin repeat protein
MCLDLVARGGDVNYRDTQFDQSTPLIVAVNTGHVEIVRALCDSEGVRLDEKDGLLGRTALCRAAYVGNVEMVRLLIDAGAGLDVLDMDENSAFVYAEEYAHPEVAALLDEAGALFIHFGKLRRKESWGVTRGK